MCVSYERCIAERGSSASQPAYMLRCPTMKDTSFRHENSDIDASHADMNYAASIRLLRGVFYELRF